MNAGEQQSLYLSNDKVRVGAFQLEHNHTNPEPLNITRISKISLEHADLRTKSTSLVDVNRRKLVQGMPTQVLQGTSLAEWF